MESVVFSQWTIGIVAVVGIAALTVGWFGSLIALLTALGNKKWAWGISMLFLGPITAILYTMIYKEAEYPRSLMLKSLMALLAVGAYMLVAYKHMA